MPFAMTLIATMTLNFRVTDGFSIQHKYITEVHKPKVHNRNVSVHQTLTITSQIPVDTLVMLFQDKFHIGSRLTNRFTFVRVISVTR